MTETPIFSGDSYEAMGETVIRLTENEYATIIAAVETDDVVNDGLRALGVTNLENMKKGKLERVLEATNE